MIFDQIFLFDYLTNFFFINYRFAYNGKNNILAIVYIILIERYYRKEKGLIVLKTKNDNFFCLVRNLNFLFWGLRNKFFI